MVAGRRSGARASTAGRPSHRRHGPGPSASRDRPSGVSPPGIHPLDARLLRGAGGGEGGPLRAAGAGGCRYDPDCGGPHTLRGLLKSAGRNALLLAFALWTASPAWAQESAFLRAKGDRIVDGEGREVLLRGMGLGGWMLQEGYMLGIKKDGTQHSIRARITD